MAPLGISLHIGVNRLDRARYPACAELRGCENDARAMAALAEARGFAPRLLLGPDARVDAVKEAVADGARRVGSDGIMLVTYSGHGGFIPNVERVKGVDDEADDQTWCLCDRQMLDDELYRLWTRFPAGARVLVISDSCHSGTVIRGRQQGPRGRASFGARGGSALRGGAALRDGGRSGARVRMLTRSEAMAEFRPNAREYRALQRALREEPIDPPQASVLLISAAQDWQTAADGPEHGLFTQALLDAWAGGAFPGSHLDLHAEIYRRLKGRQEPGYDKVGVPNPAFEAQRPFTVEPPPAGVAGTAPPG